MKISVIARTLGVAALCVAGGSCSSPSDEPGSAFVGVYDAYSLVTITPMGAPAMALPPSSSPTQIFHGTAHDLVLDDGMCLIPCDLGTTPNTMTIHVPLQCTRMVSVGGGTGMAQLMFDAGGTGTINNAGELNFTATGTFMFTPNGDAGVAGSGTFSITSAGSRQ